MQKILSLSAGVLLSIFLTCPMVAAQTTSFTYQGSLNTGGSPANGNHDFEFALFDALVAGSQLGSSQTRTNVPVANGIFAVALDFGSQFPGANRFLEIRVRTSGGGAFTPLTPRQPVNSAPYSINAAQLGGVAASQYLVSGAATITSGSQFNINSQRVLAISGTNNLFVGALAGSNNTGASNTFVGASTGQNNTTGERNAFFGANAGDSNTTGSRNTFLGAGAGSSNTTGGSNTFVGENAGRSNTTAIVNSFFGHDAGQANTTGFANAFFGNSAGRLNTTGTSNAFFGVDAGAANTTGGSNAFFGPEAGQDNTIGVNNSFFGRLSGESNTEGGGNSFYGQVSGRLNTTGNSNSFFGADAGNSNITGSNNTIIGRNADVGSDNLTNATAIGSRAFVEQNNSLVLGSINGVNGAAADSNVGIGTTAPARRLHVASGASGATSLSSSDLVIEDDTSAFQHFLTPNDVESGILFGDVTDSVGGGLIFNNAATNNGIQFRTGGNTTRMTLDGSGNLGIGTTAPVNRLTVGTPEASVLNGAIGVFNSGGTFVTVRDTTNNIEGFIGADANGVLFGSLTDSVVRIRTGNANRLTFDPTGNATFTAILNANNLFSVGVLDAGGSTPICRNPNGNFLATCGSSLRYKSNVHAFIGGLSLINRLRPVSFDWKSNGMHDVGLVAEEVAAIEPLLTTTNAKGEVEGVKYDRVGVVLVNAVKEQQAQIESQQKQIDKQDATIKLQQELLASQQAEIKRQQTQFEAFKKFVCSKEPGAELCRRN